MWRELMGFPEEGNRLDLQNQVLRKTSQWVGSLPGALLLLVTGAGGYPRDPHGFWFWAHQNPIPTHNAT